MEEIMKLAANYGFPMVVAKQSDIDMEQVQQIVEGGGEMYHTQGRL